MSDVEKHIDQIFPEWKIPKFWKYLTKIHLRIKFNFWIFNNLISYKMINTHIKNYRYDGSLETWFCTRDHFCFKPLDVYINFPFSFWLSMCVWNKQANNNNNSNKIRLHCISPQGEFVFAKWKKLTCMYV